MSVTSGGVDSSVVILLFFGLGSLKLKGVEVCPVDAGPFTQSELVAAGLVTAAADGLDDWVGEEGVEEGFHCC